MSHQAGQVLAFFALVLPIVLLPVAAYAVDATLVAGRAAGLQAATAEAAEAAAQQVDAAALRAGGVLALDPSRATLVVAQTLAAEEPGASVDSSTVSGLEVSVATSEQVLLPIGISTRTVILRARAAARLAPGYESPSNPLPLSSSTF